MSSPLPSLQKNPSSRRRKTPASLAPCIQEASIPPLPLPRKKGPPCSPGQLVPSSCALRHLLPPTPGDQPGIQLISHSLQPPCFPFCWASPSGKASTSPIFLKSQMKTPSIPPPSLFQNLMASLMPRLKSALSSLWSQQIVPLPTPLSQPEAWNLP